jgi:aconitate hydratase
LAKSFSRIHKSNLINFGIVPMEFANPDGYAKIKLGSKISVDVASTLRSDAETLQTEVDGASVEFKLTLTRRLRDILLAGGLLNYTKSSQATVSRERVLTSKEE